MSLIVFITSTFSFVAVGLYFYNKKQKVKKRVERFVSKDSNFARMQDVQKETKKKNLSLKTFIGQAAKNIKASGNRHSKIEAKLLSADLPLKVEEFIIIRLAVMGLMFFISLFLGIHYFIAIILGFIGWQLPIIYINRKKAKRIDASAKQLPQVLETMTNALKSGFSFMQAIQLVSKEISDPLGKEFQQTIKEINLGITMEEAFNNLLNRLPNKDLEIMVTAVLVQRMTGGNLAQILETIQETITERVRLQDELKALTSQGRMSALVISLLPVFLGLILSVLDPSYFSPMLTHPLGLVLLGTGIFSGILGWIFIMKIVSIEV